MSGFSGFITLAGFGAKALDLLRTVARIIERQETKKTGAMEQREGDMTNELERNASARDAARDPALDDPAGVLNDPANKYGQS